jgi:hypothetical protein
MVRISASSAASLDRTKPRSLAVAGSSAAVPIALGSAMRLSSSL